MSVLSQRYEILRPLHPSGLRKFGKTFLVKDLEHGNYAVWKEVRKGNQFTNAFEQLKSEAGFSFDKPGLPQVIATEETDHSFILVRNWIDGQSIDVVFDNIRRRNRHQFLSVIIAQCSKLLNYLHEQHIYHCDIKPGNLIVDDSGNLHLIDFGLAIDKDALVKREILFPLGYAAPELLLNRLHLVDQRTDYFALGITLWRLYTGRLPLSHQNPSIFTNLQLTHPIPDNPNIPRRILPLIEGLCSKHSFALPPNQLSEEELDIKLRKGMAQRYTNLDDFLNDFRAVKPKRWFTR
jgi:serine/threonine protein kinase